MELKEQIQEVDKWEWYITEKPKWLAEKLQKRFGTQVTSRKLHSIKRQMRKDGTLDW